MCPSPRVVDAFVVAEVSIPDDEAECEDCETLAAACEGECEKVPTVKFSFRKLWAYTGPGWLMSIAYLDPGNLTSDLQQGAYTNYKLLWVLWWATVLGWILQALCARLCVVTGMDLAQICYKEYPRWVRIMLFVQVEIAIIGADIQEVLGSAVALKILFGVSLPYGCLITAASTFSFLFILKFGVRWLEAFFIFFVAVMAMCFFVVWGKSDTNGPDFAQGWVLPEIQDYALTQAIGTVGAVIMPHNLYLHSGLVKSRNIDRNNPHKIAEGNYYNTLESGVALFLSFFVNAAVVVTFAVAFFQPSCAEVDGGPYGCVSQIAIDKQTQSVDTYGPCQGAHPGPHACCEIGLELAGDALHTALGGSSKYIWGVGLLAAGQAATMTTTYAGQFAMSGFFRIDMPAWAVVTITRVVAIGPACAIALAAGGNSNVSADMNEWLNALQSLQLPFALLPVLHFSNSKRVMGIFASSQVSKCIYWVIGFSICILNLYFVVQFFYLDDSTPIPHNPWIGTVVALYLAAYVFFVCAVLEGEIKAVLAFLKLREKDPPKPAFLKQPLQGKPSLLEEDVIEAIEAVNALD
eukprot:TRINITY_DN49030_c0_g2_i3.p1 TRINITY_DN49030_c0_g2~~TRINITY_DN49030_c0_g2_i3.p1  ORF type:complete len:577 (-),score=105.30 TRINITY_DN49030_c0_g2_i3:191-1921(-)